MFICWKFAIPYFPSVHLFICFIVMSQTLDTSTVLLCVHFFLVRQKTVSGKFTEILRKKLCSIVELYPREFLVLLGGYNPGFWLVAENNKKLQQNWQQQVATMGGCLMAVLQACSQSGSHRWELSGQWAHGHCVSGEGRQSQTSGCRGPCRYHSQQGNNPDEVGFSLT